MRRTGQKRRRTGQREGNPAELTTEHGGHGVENEVLQQAENENGFLDRMTGFAGFTGVGGKAFDLPRTLPSLGPRGSTQFC